MLTKPLSTAHELLEAIRTVAAYAQMQGDSLEVVYLKNPVRLCVTEKTLTDGSTVLDLHILEESES